MPGPSDPRRYSLFGGWTQATLPDGRVVPRQMLPRPPIRGVLGIDATGPYTPIPAPYSPIPPRLNYSPAPWVSADRAASPSVLQSTPREEFTGRQKQFLKEIGDHEGANYDAAFGMRNGRGKFITPEQFSGKKLTDMTLDEVFAYQDRLRKETRKAGYGIDTKGNIVGTSAVGRGQFVKGTLQANLRELGITDFAHTKLTPDVQDKLVINNAKRTGLDPDRTETWGNAEKVKLGRQWESLDVGKGKITGQDLDRMIARINAQSTERASKPIAPTGGGDVSFQRPVATPSTENSGPILRSAPVRGGRGNEHTKLKPQQPPRPTPGRTQSHSQGGDSWFERYFRW